VSYCHGEISCVRYQCCRSGCVCEEAVLPSNLGGSNPMEIKSTVYHFRTFWYRFIRVLSLFSVLLVACIRVTVIYLLVEWCTSDISSRNVMTTNRRSYASITIKLGESYHRGRRNMWQPASIFLLLQIHVESVLKIYAFKSTYDPSNSFVEYRGLILCAMLYKGHGTLESLSKIKMLHISSSKLGKKKK